MKWLKRTFWVVLLIGLVIAAVWAFQPQPIAVDVSPVVRGPLEVTVNEDGKTRIREKYIVSTPVAGRLQRIEFREGDAVQSGSTILASIQPANPDLLNARSLAQAKARVLAAKSAVERADVKFQQAEIEKVQAEKEYEQARKMIQTEAISQKEFDQTHSRFRTCSEAIRAAKFDKEIAAYELQLAKAALVHVQPDEESGTTGTGSDPESESAMEFFAIQSPIDGVVLRVLQESSTVVTPGTPIMEIGDADDLEIVVDLLSSDAVKIVPGTKVHIEKWGGPQSLKGVVRLIEPSAFEKISALGVEEQRVNVLIDFERPVEGKGHIGDGYRVEARLVTWSDKDVLKVSTSALFREDNQWAVFVLKEDRAVLTFVEVGHRNDREAEILGGLDEKATVILHPGDTIQDGTLVKPRGAGDESFRKE